MFNHDSEKSQQALPHCRFSLSLGMALTSIAVLTAPATTAADLPATLQEACPQVASGTVRNAISAKVFAGASAEGPELATLVIQNDRWSIDLAPYIPNPNRDFVFSVLSYDAAGNSSGIPAVGTRPACSATPNELSYDPCLNIFSGRSDTVSATARSIRVSTAAGATVARTAITAPGPWSYTLDLSAHVGSTLYVQELASTSLRSSSVALTVVSCAPPTTVTPTIPGPTATSVVPSATTTPPTTPGPPTSPVPSATTAPTSTLPTTSTPTITPSTSTSASTPSRTSADTESAKPSTSTGPSSNTGPSTHASPSAAIDSAATPSSAVAGQELAATGTSTAALAVLGLGLALAGGAGVLMRRPRRHG